MNLIALGVCAAVSILIASDALEAAELRKQQQFLDAVAGKKLVSGDSWIVISADGKVSGQSAKKEKIVGAWVWNRKFWCRNIIVGTRELPQDCQKVVLDGNIVTFSRDKGKGEAVSFTITN